MGRKTISLDGALLRHARAGEHLADIEAVVATIRADHKIAVRQEDPDPPESVEIPVGIEDQLSVRIGEHIYNLRAALDYLIYELSGHKRGTQFPIEDSSDGFNARKTGRNLAGEPVAQYLRGVRPEHCDLIESVQPYRLSASDPDARLHWTRLIRLLSNEDKHRRLVPLNGITGQPVTREEVRRLFPQVVTNVQAGQSQIIVPSTTYIEVQVDFPVEVALRKGLPAYDTLQKLQTECGAFLTLIQRAL